MKVDIIEIELLASGIDGRTEAWLAWALWVARRSSYALVDYQPAREPICVVVNEADESVVFPAQPSHALIVHLAEIAESGFAEIGDHYPMELKDSECVDPSSYELDVWRVFVQGCAAYGFTYWDYATDGVNHQFVREDPPYRRFREHFLSNRAKSPIVREDWHPTNEFIEEYLSYVESELSEPS